MNLDSKRLIQTRPYHLTLICILFDKFHSFFELVSGHLILPIFQWESGQKRKVNQYKMERGHHGYCVNLIHVGQLFSSFMLWYHPCHIANGPQIRWLLIQKLHHETMIRGCWCITLQRCPINSVSQSVVGHVIATAQFSPSGEVNPHPVPLYCVIK